MTGYRFDCIGILRDGCRDRHRALRPRALGGTTPLGAFARCLLLLGALGAAGIGDAQSAPPESVLAELEAAPAAIAVDHDCEVTVIGAPKRIALDEGWYVAYTATGADCDAAAAELERRAARLELTYARRPDRAQLRALLTPMLRTARTISGCRLTVHGEPRIDSASAHWFVSYRATGTGCDEAADELRRQGDEFDIIFLEQPPPSLLRDLR